MFLGNSLSLLSLQVSVREVSACSRCPNVQAETQTEAILAPENAVLGESVESKSKRGGKRAGACRKPNLAKHLLKGFSPAAIPQAVENVDIGAIVVGLARNKR